MKILHIGKYYPPYFGGIEKVNYDIVEGLNMNGVQTDVLCSNHNKGNAFSEVPYKTYRTHTLKFIASTPLSYSIITTLKKIQDNYDIIHVHLPNPMANLAIFITRPKAKIILHWHSDIINQKNLLKLYSPLQAWLLKRANKIVITTPTYLEGSDTLKKYKNKIVCIPIGIDNKELFIDQNTLNNLKNKYKGYKIIFSLGRLVYYKGFEYLIEAARSLPNDIIILIAGIGELKEKLQQQISKHNLQDRVKLLGKIPFKELGAYYQLCDIFCLPSTERSEAFGVVQIEAMAFGKPIISTSIKGSGVDWVNLNDVSGIIVPPKDTNKLAEAVTALLTDEEKYQWLSIGAKKRYEEEFTKDKMVNSFKNLYLEILES
ncbi:glycosyltransferase [Capnocytophaga gingivalis]